MKSLTWSFIIVAAGVGNRMGGAPKQFRLLGSRPVWKWSASKVESLWREGLVSELVLVVPERDIEEVIAGNGMKMPIKVVSGGQMRADSVLNGLRICSGSHVLVHDGARPFISVELCRRVMEGAAKHGSAIPVLPTNDALEVKYDDEIQCIDRINFFRVQTPQAFEKERLIAAIEDYGTRGADEATAWEATRNRLHHVQGEEMNFKITSPYDWVVAQSLVGIKKETRTGHGYDVHQLVPGRKLILAGIEIEGAEKGLLGYSDADIISHTIMDAILGAAGEPDIGTLFPADDPLWEDAESAALLKIVVERVRNKGWEIEWVDVTLSAQKPRLGGMIPAFISNLAPYLRESSGKLNLNIKVKSGEECGSVGRGECMMCWGIATLTKYGV